MLTLAIRKGKYTRIPMKEREHQKVIFMYTLDHLPSFLASILPTNHKTEDLNILKSQLSHWFALFLTQPMFSPKYFLVNLVG